MSDRPPPRAKVRLSYRIFRGIFAVIFYTYFRGRVYHKQRVPREGRALIVSNHQSHLDPAATTLALTRECHYVARDSLFRIPVVGRFIAHVNAIPIKRGAADVTAIKEILRRLKNECAVVVFPEGTRSTDGLLGDFKANALAVAKKTKSPIIPVTIWGAYQAMPRGTSIPRPRRIRVAYAEPITADEVAAWDDATIAATVRERIAENLARFDRGERPA